MPDAPTTDRPIKRLRGTPFVHDYVTNHNQYKVDRVGMFQRVFRACGDLGSFRVGRRTYYLVGSVEVARDLLVRNGMLMDKPERFRRAMMPLLGDGLLGSRNDVNARHRPLIRPQFKKKVLLETTARTAVAHTRGLSAAWPDGGTVDVYAQMMRIVMLNVATDVFGRDVSADAQIFGQALNEAIAEFNVGVGARFQFLAMLPLPSRRRYLAAIQRMDEAFQRILDDHRAMDPRPDDWVSALLECRYEDGSPLSDRQIRDEAINLLMAGTETTGSAMTWTLHLLATHPEIYARVLAEVDGVLQGRAATVADLPNLTYTMQVLKESMRIYPPVYMFSREAAEELVVQGYRVPKGANVLFSTYLLHHREDYFPDPERFDPDRFTPERERAIPAHAYMPFATGHRICIGNNHALLNAGLMLATLCQTVTVQPDPDHRVGFEPKLTLRPRNGMPMRVTRRPQPGSGSAGAGAGSGAGARADGASADGASASSAPRQAEAQGCPYRVTT